VPVGLLVVGDGVARRKLEALVKRYAAVAVMPYLADRSELARLVASADALVHGCEAETFCMVAAEARASGIPLIVPDRGAAVDQRVAGAGAIYHSGNRRSLEQAIVEFVDRGPELQRAAAARACQVRTMDEHFGDLFAHYHALAPAGTRVTQIAARSFASLDVESLPGRALAGSALHRKMH
jgi:alpha-1,6-mannosyltransferase